ncbi:purine-binding protein precursor [Anaerotignum neopropionicum]|uniref:Purine-binding protein n=1 Tax=Anaerotignum neopropionicum TaxID=36847 RepID=A0A136WJ53_9FIRM|nr:BMP family ABC transporter substrate-binding protein [Anaerotignum neopropionicum]KXL54463.1 purine-binding protein precursor [Anaerotignum neopropionicum]
MKKFTKFLALALAVTMSMTALVGCGGSASKPADQAAEAGDTAEATKVGFIYIGSQNDGGYSQAQHNGTKAVQEYFGDKVETIIAENVAEEKQTVKTTAINMIDQGCTIVIGTSFGFMDALDELAEEYPDVTFLHFSGNKMNDTNFGNYFGAMEEPRYLSGMIAGMMTKTNKLGYVAAFPYTEVHIGINAFTLGAQSVNPDVEVKVVYTNSWGDPAGEKAAAESLLAQDCDIITQHADSAGPQLAAESAGKLAIGYNLDNSEIVPGAFLTAPVWHHDKYLVPTIEKIIAGTYVPESYYGTMKDGYIGLAPMTDLVPQDVQDKVNEVAAKMEAGEFPVFAGPIYDTDGSVLVPEGEALDRAGIWTVMQSLVKGVSAVN